MAERYVTYPLAGELRYLRRRAVSTLLLSLGRRLAKLEQEGQTVEHLAVYPEAGEWAAVVLVQDPNKLYGGAFVVAPEPEETAGEPE